MPSLTEENYLKALFHLAPGAADTVPTTELAAHLGVSKPTVTSMLKTLARRGFVHYEPYRPARLSDPGRRAAAAVVRKHRLTEMFLVEKMGFGWAEVHAIAEQMEHIDAPEFFARMDELLGFPTVDPHGSPIPDAAGLVQRGAYQPLTEVAPGTTARLRAIGNSSAELLQFLTRKGIALDTELTLLRREPFDGSLVVRYGGREEMLSLEVGRCLLVGG